MGKVYSAKDSVSDKDVAIKVLLDVSSAEDGGEQRFLQEVHTIARLQDPRILKLIESGVLPDGRLCMVTELLRGKNLQETLKEKGRLDPEFVVRVMIDVCYALIEAHAAGVVHRDIKPANLFLHENLAGEYTTKVLDFGVAKVREGSAISVDGPNVETRDGLAVGSVAYMPPEQAGLLGKKGSAIRVDGRSDLYSLGVVAYHCVTGLLPFIGEPLEVLQHHAYTAVPSFADKKLTLEPRWRGFEAIVLRLMAKHPKDRYQTPEELRADLERLLYEQPTRPSRTPQLALVGSLVILSGVLLFVIVDWSSEVRTVKTISVCEPLAPPEGYLAPDSCKDSQLFRYISEEGPAAYARLALSKAQDSGDPKLWLNGMTAYLSAEGKCDAALRARASFEPMFPPELKDRASELILRLEKSCSKDSKLRVEETPKRPETPRPEVKRADTERPEPRPKKVPSGRLEAWKVSNLGPPSTLRRLRSRFLACYRRWRTPSAPNPIEVKLTFVGSDVEVSADGAGPTKPKLEACIKKEVRSAKVEVSSILGRASFRLKP